MSTLAKKKRIAEQHAEDKKYLLNRGWICKVNDEAGEPIGSEVWSLEIPENIKHGYSDMIYRPFRQAYKMQLQFDYNISEG